MTHLVLAALVAAADADAELKALSAALCGSYSSAAQAKADRDFFDVRLEMVPIWPDRKGEHWIYVEQAMATALDKPYRQRVYRLVAADGKLVSKVYTLPGDPLQFAGAWKDATKLAGLTPDKLTEKDGCGLAMTKDGDGKYTGSTAGVGCKSDLRGASYATSEVKLAGDTLTTWDRGYDAAGKQVWGAVKGPYVFVRQKPAK